MRLILLAFLLFATTRCVTTQVTPASLDPNLSRLERTAERSVTLRVSPVNDPLEVGHQYLFVVVPFGAIYLTDPSRAIEAAVRLELALAGMSAEPVRERSTHPTVTVALTAASVTAYDLIVTRRIRAHVALTVVVQGAGDSPAVTFETEGASASFERFGFAPQLTAAFSEALRNAAREAVIDLQSAGTFRYHSSERSAPRSPGAGAALRLSKPWLE